MAEYKSWMWKPATGPIDTEAARRSKTLLRLAIAWQACTVLGLIVGTVLGASFPLPLWLALLAGIMLLLGAIQRPMRPRASDFLTLTGFVLSLASVTLILTAKFPR